MPPRHSPPDPGLSDPGIGGRIRTARLAMGMTQDDLARVVGVSRSAVAQWETGRAGQTRDTLMRVAKALHLPPAHLLLGEDSAPAATGLTGNELALLRLYRACAPGDQTILLQTARRLAQP